MQYFVLKEDNGATKGRESIAEEKSKG